MRVASSAILVEEALQHVNDELHRRVIVVEQQNAVEVRPLRPRLGLRDDRRAGATAVVSAAGRVGAAHRMTESCSVGGQCPDLSAASCFDRPFALPLAAHSAVANAPSLRCKCIVAPPASLDQQAWVVARFDRVKSATLSTVADGIRSSCGRADQPRNEKRPARGRAFMKCSKTIGTYGSGRGDLETMPSIRLEGFRGEVGDRARRSWSTG